jgi:hypothetical protein
MIPKITQWHLYFGMTKTWYRHSHSFNVSSVFRLLSKIQALNVDDFFIYKKEVN